MAQQPTQNPSGVCNLIHKPPEGCAHPGRTERRLHALSGQEVEVVCCRMTKYTLGLGSGSHQTASSALSGQVVEVVCCRMTEMQAGLYTHFLTSNAARRLLSGQKAARVLSAITGTTTRVARHRAARNECRKRMLQPNTSCPCTA